MRDREAGAASPRQSLAWPIWRISVGHDALIDTQAHEQLAQVLAPNASVGALSLGRTVRR